MNLYNRHEFSLMFSSVSEIILEANKQVDCKKFRHGSCESIVFFDIEK